MQTYVEALEAMEIETRDNGLAGYCEFREQWELETDVGTEYVPMDVADVPDAGFADEMTAVFGDYIEGREVYSGERVSRWCAYWSMPGCLDRGMDHIADTEAEAIADLLTYDGTNEPLEDGVPQWEYDALYRLAELADSGDALAIETMRHNGVNPSVNA